MNPRPSVSIPARSSSMSPVTARRPTATSSRSATCCPSPSSRTRTAPSARASMRVTVRPVTTAMPSAANTSSSTLEVSGSSRATRRGRASTIVTAVPTRRKAWASSQPMAPPPSTISDRGAAASSNTFSFVRYARSASPSIGGTTGRAPVATTIRRARIDRPPTSSSVGARNRARPSRTSTPSRPSTSGVSVAAMRSMLRCTPAMASAKGSPRFAASMNAFDGTHPVKVQSPPIGPSCTSSVRTPRRAPARAAPRPPAPPPTTTRSKSAGAFMRRGRGRTPRRRTGPRGVATTPR